MNNPETNADKKSVSSPLSYSEQQKLTRMARALQDEGYDEAYVARILSEKGISDSDIRLIIFNGKRQVYEDRYRQNRTVLIVIGLGWAAIVVLYLATMDNPPPGAIQTRSSGYISARMIGYAALLFGGTLFRHIYLWNKLREMSK